MFMSHGHYMYILYIRLIEKLKQKQKEREGMKDHRRTFIFLSSVSLETEIREKSCAGGI